MLFNEMDEFWFDSKSICNVLRHLNAGGMSHQSIMPRWLNKFFDVLVDIFVY
jgi:hypothetical protein